MSPCLPHVNPDGPTSTVDLPHDRQVVWDVLVDPTTYPDWLIGAHRIRGVDADWPRAGTAFHHVVGFGPFKIADRTDSLRVQEPEHLELLAKAGSLFKAHVVFEVHEGVGGGTRVDFYERPERGLLAWIWNGPLCRPLLSVGIWGRNAGSLGRLKTYLEEHGGKPRPG